MKENFIHEVDSCSNSLESSAQSVLDNPELLCSTMEYALL